MGSTVGRVPALLAWGCALVLGVSLSGCASSRDAGVSDPAGHVRFTVPGDWRPVGPSALAAELEKAVGNTGEWSVAYEADPHQKATDFLSFGIAEPFVFAEYGDLTAAAGRQLSDQGLRDFFLPVSSPARQKATSEGNPLTGFRPFRDQVLTPGNGVHEVRETFDYTYNRQVDTWDEAILTDAAHTVVFVLAVHCTTACYGKHQAEISRVMSSVTGSALGRPTGPFTSVIGR